MSSCNKRYDPQSQELYNQASTGPVRYLLGTPSTPCHTCFSDDPSVRIQQRGVDHRRRPELIQTSNHFLFRHADGTLARDAADVDLPVSSIPPAFSDATSTPLFKSDDTCTLLGRDTRLTNPPSTLRGIEVNRWGFPLVDPQANVDIRFPHVLDTRIITKDAHRPIIPVPLDQTKFFSVICTNSKLLALE